jgi:hypothetical protein
MKRNIYKLLSEKYEQHILENTEFDSSKFKWEKENLKVGNEVFDVYCNFEYGEQATDYKFNPRTGQGQDKYAEVPVAVTDIKAFRVDPTRNGLGDEVTDPELLKAIAGVALETARDEGGDDRGTRYGDWM